MNAPATSPGTALVTGPTAGIGLSFAHQLAARGHDLVLVARNQARLVEVAAELRLEHGVQVEVLSADLTDREQLAKVEARLADPDQPIELLVNNAGFGLKERFLDNDVDAETAMLDVLVTAVLRLSHAAMGPMAERGHGGVINVSSVAAFLPRGRTPPPRRGSTASPSGRPTSTRDQGVTVMALCPGFTKTEFHERMKVKRGTGPMWLDADKLVATALADFDKGRTYSIPSPQYKAIVTLSKLVPNRALQSYQSIGRK